MAALTLGDNNSYLPARMRSYNLNGLNWRGARSSVLHCLTDISVIMGLYGNN